MVFDLPTKMIIRIAIITTTITETIVPAIIPDGVPLEVGVSEYKLKDETL